LLCLLATHYFFLSFGTKRAYNLYQIREINLSDYAANAGLILKPELANLTGGETHELGQS